MVGKWIAGKLLFCTAVGVAGMGTAYAQTTDVQTDTAANVDATGVDAQTDTNATTDAPAPPADVSTSGRAQTDAARTGADANLSTDGRNTEANTNAAGTRANARLNSEGAQIGTQTNQDGARAQGRIGTNNGRVGASADGNIPGVRAGVRGNATTGNADVNVNSDVNSGLGGRQNQDGTRINANNRVNAGTGNLRDRVGITFDSGMDNGLIIQQTTPSSLAAGLGLMAGDRILGFNGRTYASADQFYTDLDQINMNSNVPIIYERDGRIFTRDMRFSQWNNGGYNAGVGYNGNSYGPDSVSHSASRPIYGGSSQTQGVYSNQVAGPGCGVQTTQVGYHQQSYGSPMPVYGQGWSNHGYSYGRGWDGDNDGDDDDWEDHQKRMRREMKRRFDD